MSPRIGVLDLDAYLTEFGGERLDLFLQCRCWWSLGLGFESIVA